jgi:hypothetical protein
MVYCVPNRKIFDIGPDFYPSTEHHIMCSALFLRIFEVPVSNLSLENAELNFVLLFLRLSREMLDTTTY